MTHKTSVACTGDLTVGFVVLAAWPVRNLGFCIAQCHPAVQVPSLYTLLSCGTLHSLWICEVMRCCVDTISPLKTSQGHTPVADRAASFATRLLTIVGVNLY